MNVSHQKHVEQAQRFNRSQFGFWVYLMTDCVLFAALFATFAVMRIQTNGGPTGGELFDLPFVLIETVLLLTSSFTCGLMLIALQCQDKTAVLRYLAVTALLGAVFVGMELYEFRSLAMEGASWQRSGFLSAYFTLVATHGLHIVVGLIWIATLLFQVLRRGLTGHLHRRLQLLGMFWHFLDVVWIFIFSIVYLWSGRV